MEDILNDQFLGELENTLKTATPVSMNTILRNADAGDLSFQKDTFVSLLTAQALEVADRLHHRADMMRRRADEFDSMADSLTKSSYETCHSAGGVVDSIETILDVLQEHAHIEPVQVK